MVRKQEVRGGGGGDRTLSVKVPSLFRCPISLDVMKSPVSLCTGVTYDRSSIQRWLESGNNTCPATMQPLPSTDLVPNITLQRLINIWAQAGPIKHHPARALLAEIRSSAADPSPSSIRKLAAFFDDKDADEFEKNQLITANGCAEILSSIISNSLTTTTTATRLESLEEAVGVVSRILASECIEEDNKQITITAIATSRRNLGESVTSLIRVLKEGRSVETRSNAAAVIASVLANVSSDSKILLAENEELIPELIRLIGEEKQPGIDAGLSCLVQLSGVRRARGRMVQLGMVPILTRILSHDAAVLPAEAAEKAMKLMEAASGCSDGREAMCEAAEATISAILKWTRKCGREGTEAAVVVLWSLCHLFRDRRAQEAVEANGGLTKILVMMQTGCSPAARQMAGDLLKIFRVNSKCCLAGYDTKTTHIMPF